MLLMYCPLHFILILIKIDFIFANTWAYEPQHFTSAYFMKRFPASLSCIIRSRQGLSLNPIWRIQSTSCEGIANLQHRDNHHMVHLNAFKISVGALLQLFSAIVSGQNTSQLTMYVAIDNMSFHSADNAIFCLFALEQVHADRLMDFNYWCTVCWNTMNKEHIVILCKLQKD